ncbi:hypothetical protein [Enterococcus hirae]|uniref:hypothetical protein n=1 Tax=Enterococcus hirae TaxID=1354 RepID=UPI00159CA086|nr:hypothetical protein [Enterococcus hirae]MBA5271211.1 hypothetical protein [Enterococcus hirae]NVL98795.1 hypothetical protein [Enterococcus hirae]
MDKFTSKTVQGNGEKAKVTANIQENAEVKDQKEVNSNMPFIQQKIEEIFTLQWGIQEVGQSLIAILINRKEQYIKENSRNLNESKKEQTQQASSNMKEMKKVRNTNKKPSLLKVMFNKLMRRSKNKDKKEVNSPNNPIEPSGIENTSLLKQKIGEIFIFDEVIRETQGKELTESGKKVSEYVKNQKNQLIEEMSKEFNESDKASGIENPVSSLINQKLEENFEANQFVQKYEKDQCYAQQNGEQQLDKWMEMIGEIKRWAKTNKIDLLELEKNLTLSPSPENLGQKKIVEGTTRAGGKLERQEEKLGENRHSKDRNQFNGQRTHR